MLRVRCLLLSVSLLVVAPLRADDATREVQPAIEKGQRVFTAGHSFHVFMPNILRDIVKSAGINDHVQVGVSSIGGSRVIQHWKLPDEKNKGKKALAEDKVDVLTLSPIWHPDEGIDLFTELALKHNPNVRVLVQAFWLPYDQFDVNYQKKRPEPVDRNKRTGEEMRKIFEPYNKSVVEQVEALNKKHGKTVVYVVPCGQAQIALREKIIAGAAPGLKEQNDLFTDAIGHPKPALRVLAAYCHYAVIYRKSPVGLPVPAALGKADDPDTQKLNRLLQELAWQAALEHPHSGVRKN
ncbi:MAG: hypothetical protein AB7K24_28480 [Gemmataceae bacterium]